MIFNNVAIMSRSCAPSAIPTAVVTRFSLSINAIGLFESQPTSSPEHFRHVVSPLARHLVSALTKVRSTRFRSCVTSCATSQLTCTGSSPPAVHHPSPTSSFATRPPPRLGSDIIDHMATFRCTSSATTASHCSCEIMQCWTDHAWHLLLLSVRHNAVLQILLNDQHEPYPESSACSPGHPLSLYHWLLLLIAVLTLSMGR